MKIVVIGSKGFIGSHAYKFLAEEKSNDCWACDVTVDYVDGNYFQIDATNSNFSELFSSIQFDYCINCSGAASVPDSFKNPMRDYTLNTSNVARILEAIRRYSPFCKFINLSSAAVYGNQKTLPIHERLDCKPQSPYGNHKLYAEQLCSEYFRFFGVRSCSLRIFSAYGPGLTKQIFWDVYQKSRNSGSIELSGTGEETRDFIFVDDILQALTVVMAKAEFCAEVYNIASGVETTIIGVINQFLKILEFEGSLRFSQELRFGDPTKWRADIERIQALGFKAEISLIEGLKKYALWLAERRSV